jgi:REP element-mobilizing transposase RayT
VAYKRRIEVPGAYYHVVTRGNNRRHIAHVDDDHRLFLMIVQSVAAAYGWKIIAYVLMPNHYHLVIKLGASEKGLSRGMCFLNTAYATEYNQRYKRINHLFGKRYWSRMIEDDVQLIRTCRYILLNPVRADLRAHPGDWTWSSYNAMLGRAVRPRARGGATAIRGVHRSRDRRAGSVRTRPGGTRLAAASVTRVRPRAARAAEATSACTRGRCRPPVGSGGRLSL